jgi:hypothetical protein
MDHGAPLLNCSLDPVAELQTNTWAGLIKEEKRNQALAYNLGKRKYKHASVLSFLQSKGAAPLMLCSLAGTCIMIIQRSYQLMCIQTVVVPVSSFLLPLNIPEPGEDVQ